MVLTLFLMHMFKKVIISYKSLKFLREVNVEQLV